MHCCNITLANYHMQPRSCMGISLLYWSRTTRNYEQNGWHLWDDIFKCIFLNGDYCTVIQISLNVASKDQLLNDWWLIQTVALHRIDVVTWTIDDPVYWRMYTSTVLSTLRAVMTMLPHSHKLLTLCWGGWGEVGFGESVESIKCWEIGPTPAPSFSSHSSYQPGQITMTSSNGNIFRATGPLCGDFTGHRWIPLTKATDAEFWCFLWSVAKQTVE